jgi:hypothetical protein
LAGHEACLGELRSVSKFWSENVEGFCEHNNESQGSEDVAYISFAPYESLRVHCSYVGHYAFTYVAYLVFDVLEVSEIGSTPILRDNAELCRCWSSGL